MQIHITFDSIKITQIFHANGLWVIFIFLLSLLASSKIYLISDSTGETLDRIFLALKAQFLNIEYKVHSYSFTRTENQILKILEDAKKSENSIILYTIVDNNLAKYLANESEKKKIPCFGVLGNLILNFSNSIIFNLLRLRTDKHQGSRS